MNFLPEDDQQFLKAKELAHELKTERLPDGNERRGVLFPGFRFESNLAAIIDEGLAACSSCDMIVLIPSGYSTTRLDSFYTSPRLKRLDGGDPHQAAGEQELFGSKWQFWSRHLDDSDWRDGQDGLETFLQYVRDELRKA